MKLAVLMSMVMVCQATFAETPQFTVNFFIQEYPDEQVKAPNINEGFGPKYAVIKHKFYQPVNRGIYVAYNGYLADANENGLVSLPRKTQQEEFNLLIAESLKPIYGLENTVQAWHITDPQHSAMYHIKRYQDDETDLYYWKVLETNLPHDYKVPLHTIIVIAQPKDIYVPLGATPTNKEPNLLLPPMYARRGLDHIKQSLFILLIKQFYSDVRVLKKAEPSALSEMITT